MLELVSVTSAVWVGRWAVQDGVAEYAGSAPLDHRVSGKLQSGSELSESDRAHPNVSMSDLEAEQNPTRKKSSPDQRLNGPATDDRGVSIRMSMKLDGRPCVSRLADQG